MKVPIGMIISTNWVRPDNAIWLDHSVVKDLRTYTFLSNWAIFPPKRAIQFLLKKNLKAKFILSVLHFYHCIMPVVIHCLFLNHVCTLN